MTLTTNWNKQNKKSEQLNSKLDQQKKDLDKNLNQQNRKRDDNWDQQKRDINAKLDKQKDNISGNFEVLGKHLSQVQRQLDFVKNELQCEIQVQKQKLSPVEKRQTVNVKDFSNQWKLECDAEQKLKKNSVQDN